MGGEGAEREESYADGLQPSLQGVDGTQLGLAVGQGNGHGAVLRALAAAG
jgi:hypothetical protein